MKGKQTENLKKEPLREAQKDPEFMRDIAKFIKATTNIYKLN